MGLILAAVALVFSVVCLRYFTPREYTEVLIQESAPSFSWTNPYFKEIYEFMEIVRNVGFYGRIYGLYRKRGFSTALVREYDGKTVLIAPTRDFFYDLYAYVAIKTNVSPKIETRSIRTMGQVIAVEEQADFGNIAVVYKPCFSVVTDAEKGYDFRVDLVTQGLLNHLFAVAERGEYTILLVSNRVIDKVRKLCQELGFMEVPVSYLRR